MPNYLAYGLSLASELPLPELSFAASPRRQITLHLGEVHFAGFSPGRVLYKPISPTEVIVHYEGVGTALVSEGSVITLQPAADGDPVALRLFVLQQVFGVLLLQRGFFVLHSSAASIGGQTVAFAGASGEGKSTIVAALNREGCQIKTDDVLAIDTTDPQRPMALPGLVQLKLTEETRAWVAPGIAAEQTIRDRVHKKLYDLHGSTLPEPTPLIAIYLLETGLNVEWISVPPAQGAIELIRHTYGARLLHAAGLSNRHFQQAADLARRVPITILRRPRVLDLLPEIVAHLKQSLPLSAPIASESEAQKFRTESDPAAVQTKS